MQVFVEEFPEKYQPAGDVPRIDMDKSILLKTWKEKHSKRILEGILRTILTELMKGTPTRMPLL